MVYLPNVSTLRRKFTPQDIRRPSSLLPSHVQAKLMAWTGGRVTASNRTPTSRMPRPLGMSRGESYPAICYTSLGNRRRKLRKTSGQRAARGHWIPGKRETVTPTNVSLTVEDLLVRGWASLECFAMSTAHNSQIR